MDQISILQTTILKHAVLAPHPRPGPAPENAKKFELCKTPLKKYKKWRLGRIETPTPLAKNREGTFPPTLLRRQLERIAAQSLKDAVWIILLRGRL